MSTNIKYFPDHLRPYDDSLWDDYSMYDNMPYYWSMDTERIIAVESGNVIKSHRCRISEKPYVIRY